MSQAGSGPRFATREPVDFVVIGSGSAGGVLARELAINGHDVVVLEQGPWRDPSEFVHDELGELFHQSMTSGQPHRDPQTHRYTADEEAQVRGFPPPAFYARTVGGSSVHYSANYWRFRPVDFDERSRLGAIAGTGFADWPITYEELEPYYTRVDWEVGVSGAPGPEDAPRSKPFPCPPMPLKSSGALLDKGARALGMTTQNAPVAILSRPHNGRSPCIHCGFCIGFGCEVGAKSSTLAGMIPEAIASGRCEVRTESMVVRMDTDARGRISEVVYLDKAGNEQAQRARAVVLAANGAETPRLLLASASSRFPDGLGNDSGLVGKYLMYNGHSASYGLFDEPLNEYKSIQCTRLSMDYYDADPKRGFYGGGGIDARPLLNSYPIFFALQGLPPDTPQWGAEYKRRLAHYFTRNMAVMGNTTSLALETNNVTLDPNVKDVWGRPAIRVTYNDHADDMSFKAFMRDRGEAILEAAGATEIWSDPVKPETIGAHLLGTCRMGDDPATSVVDRFHRSHQVPNLFICDGSSFVTSGRGQPTMTIQALAFRAADHLRAFASRNEI